MNVSEPQFKTHENLILNQTILLRRTIKRFTTGMMSLVTLVILFTAITSGYFKGNIRSTSWKKTGFRDVILDLRVINVTAPTVSHCAALCLDGKQICLSFAYHKMEHVCLLYPDRPYTEHQASPYTGLIYYWTHVACPKDYTYNGDLELCFKVYTNLFAVYNQKVAQNKCHDDGGYLLFMDSSARMTFIYNYVAKQGDGKHNYQVGGNDIGDTGNYRWFDGRSVDQALWKKNEPDKSDNCMLSEPIAAEKAYTLITTDCVTQWHYICEIPV